MLSIYDYKRKMSHQIENMQVAYHEAGHTVIGLLTFMKISNVSVVEDVKISGETDYDQMTSEQCQDPVFSAFQIKADLFLLYAGLMAEKIFYQDMTGSKKFPAIFKKGIESDIGAIAKIISSNNLAPPGPKRFLFKKKIMKEVRQLLEQHWEVVKIVAHALFERKKLAYDDLRKIICRKTSNKKFWKKQFNYINEFFDKNKKLNSRDLKIITSAIN